MKKWLATLLCLVLVLGCLPMVVLADEEAAPFTISRALGDHMVLQRDAEIRIWGFSDKKGEKIAVTFKGKTTETTVKDDGTWEVKLPAEAAEKNPQELKATMGDYTVTLTDILIGDVYLVGGQSNAEKTLSACGNEYTKKYKEELIASGEDMIRYFQQGRNDVMGSAKNKALMLQPQLEPLKGKKWKNEKTSVINEFSAMGVFFAHKMYDTLKVPIGMIMVASSGSPVSQLMSAEASKATGYTRFENDIPVSGMYNTLMNPFIKMTIKGMIYYQGESEMGLAVSDYGKYNEYVNAYVEDLRAKMEQDFPFFFVQVSSHDGTGITSWPQLKYQRAVQFDGLKVIKNSGMVVSMDQGYRDGDSDWAHPNYKKPVGDRLADLALCRLYGIGDEEYVTSPMPDYAYKAEGGVMVHFTHVGDGLKQIGSKTKLLGFSTMTNATTFEPVEAEIVGKNEVLLKGVDADKAFGIAYGMEILAFVEFEDEKYVANLGNSNELPAPSFEIRKAQILAEKPADPTPAPTEAPTADPAQPAEPTAKPEKQGCGSSFAMSAACAAVILPAAIVFRKKKED